MKDVPLPKAAEDLLDALDEEQLAMLNRRTAEKLNHLQRMKQLRAMERLAPLDRVSFLHDGRRINGIVSRFHRKTVTVTAEDGIRWKVSPSLLTKHGNIIDVFRSDSP